MFHTRSSAQTVVSRYHGQALEMVPDIPISIHFSYLLRLDHELYIWCTKILSTAADDITNFFKQVSDPKYVVILTKRFG